MNVNETIEIKGAIHLHTTFSDGGVDFPTLISVSKKVGLDFIVPTDHMTLKGKIEGFNKKHGDLLVVVGYEHNDEDNKNHYLVIGTDEVASGNKAVEYVKQVKKLGGIGIVAHPMERRDYLEKFPPYPWTDWDVDGFDGIELWNQMSEWVESLRPWTRFFRILHPRRFLKNISKEVKQKWDELNTKSFVSGIGGVDAHTFHFKLVFFTVKIFPIKVELKGIRTHLYVDKTAWQSNYSVAQNELLKAIKNGHGFISNYRRGDATGTQIKMIFSDGTVALPGRQNSKGNLPAKLSVKIPSSALVKLVRNGKYISSDTGTDISFDIFDKGLYRIEVFKKKHGWIYSNPFPVGEYPFTD